MPEETTMAHIIHDASRRDTAGEANLAADEERILRFLGAAVVMQWNTLPTKLQRELLDTAASLDDLVKIHGAHPYKRIGDRDPIKIGSESTQMRVMITCLRRMQHPIRCDIGGDPASRRQWR
jgi:hypothetical protein